MKSYEEILRDLKNKIYYPVYILTGEQAYYIDAISDYIEEHLLQPEDKEFNQTILYGRETDVQTIAAECRRFPMMSNYQLILIKEAQDIRNLDLLTPYLENPMASTVLVICYKYGTLDKRKTFARVADKKAVLFEAPKIYDNQVAQWIASYVKEKGYTIDAKAAALMADFLGTDLAKIVNEVGKMIISLPAGATITPTHVEDNIGISKDYNVFELSKALANRNVFKANQIVKYFADNPRDNPLVMVIPVLHNYFQKVFIYHHLTDKSEKNVAAALLTRSTGEYITAARNYPKAKVKQIFSVFREYDLRSKGIGNSSAGDGDLMKEMIYKILH